MKYFFRFINYNHLNKNKFFINIIYVFIIANRKKPKAIKAPIIAPITATTLSKTMYPNEYGAAPMKLRIPANQRKTTPTISPIIIKNVPTILLFPDPK